VGRIKRIVKVKEAMRNTSNIVNELAQGIEESSLQLYDELNTKSIDEVGNSLEQETPSAPDNERRIEQLEETGEVYMNEDAAH